MTTGDIFGDLMRDYKPTSSHGGEVLVADNQTLTEELAALGIIIGDEEDEDE